VRLNDRTTLVCFKGPFLIVAPKSVIGHWERELEEWTDMNVVTYNGDAHTRELMRENELYMPGNRKLLQFHVLVTTYEILLLDEEKLGRLPWAYIVVDEAHRLKNSKSKSKQLIKGLGADHMLLLTGTPIQNNVDELYTMLNLMDDHQYSEARRAWTFISAAHTVGPSDCCARFALAGRARALPRTLLQARLVGRRREAAEAAQGRDAAADEGRRREGHPDQGSARCVPPHLLPPYVTLDDDDDGTNMIHYGLISCCCTAQEETIVWVELAPRQKELYRALLDRSRAALTGSTVDRYSKVGSTQVTTGSGHIGSQL
jgi:hypothetical protein